MTVYSWATDASGDWSDAANWSPSAPPDSTGGNPTDVTINTADFATITYSTGTLTIGSLTVGNDAFSVTGGMLTALGAASFGNSLAVTGDGTVLQLTGGSIGTAGALSVGTGATLSFTGGTFTIDSGGMIGAAGAAGAIALAGGTLELGGNNITANPALLQTGGILDGTGMLTLNNGLTVDTGTAVETGAGRTVALGTSAIGGGALDLDGGHILENQGTLTWSGGEIGLGVNPLGAAVGGGAIQNDRGAIFDITTDTTATDGTIGDGLGANSFSNSGTFEKTAGTGTTTIEAPFTNTGTIEVDTGTLEFDGAYNDSVVIQGAGTVKITGAASFTGGPFETGTGTTLVTGATSVTGILQLDGGRVFENQGTLTLSANALYLGYNPGGTILGGATLQNDAGATLDITSDINIAKEMGATAFVNAGTLQKTGTTGTSYISTTFTNTGTVSVAAGTLELDGGGSSTADAFTIAAGATLAIGGSLNVFTFTSGTIGGAGTFVQNFSQISGSLTIAGTAMLGGGSDPNNFYGPAEQTGAGTTLLQGTTTINGLLDLDGGHVLENQGMVTWTNGLIGVGFNPNLTTLGGGIIQNDASGTFDIASDGTIFKGSGTDGFTNAGLLEKTVTTGLTTIKVNFTNTGTVSVQTGTLEFDGGGSLAASAVTVAAGATLAIGGGNDVFTINGGLGSTGTFAQTGGTLSGNLTINGAAALGGTSYYAAAEEVGNGTTLLKGTTTIGGYLDLDGGHVLENKGNLTWTNGQIVLGNNPNAATLGDGTILNDAGATFSIQTDFELFGDTGTTNFENDGTLTKSVTTGISEIGPDFTNTGTVSVMTGTLIFARAVEDLGSISVAAGAALTLNGDLTGGGGITVNGAGTLTLAGAVASSEAITLTGQGATLNLGDPTDVETTITGFTTGDTIDLTALDLGKVAGYQLLSGNVLEIDETGGATLDIGLGPSDDFTGEFFHFNYDGVTGTDITVDTVACFLFGTLIATDTGEVPVQDLAIGDRVVTLSGAARPIKWIGRRGYAQPFAGGNDEITPILVKAGALGPNVPVRDLHVSPLHALYIDEVLVPAGLLVNGVSILRSPMALVRYFHIELDSHDVIFADGAPAESFVDCDTRSMFQNAAEFARLYPGDSASAWTLCAPRVEQGATLRRIWRAIAARAGIAATDAPHRLEGWLDHVDGGAIQGWAWTPDRPDTPVELEVLDGDGVIARVFADRHRQDLCDAGIGDGRHAFTLRATLAPWRSHRIHVRRAADGVELSGSPIAIAATAGLDLLRDERFGRALETALSEATTDDDLDAVLALFLKGAEAARRIKTHRRLGPADDAEATRALAIGERTPTPPEVERLTAFARLGYQVEYIAMRQTEDDPAIAEHLAALGVTCHQAPMTTSVEQLLRQVGDRYALVYLNRLGPAAAYTGLVRSFCPRARIVFDAGELQHPRLAEQGKIEQRPDLLARARSLKAAELLAMRQADAVIVSTPADAAYLARAFPGARVHVVPAESEDHPLAAAVVRPTPSITWMKREG